MSRQDMSVMSGMNHDHGDMDMGDETCSMSMVFTWSYKNTCVIFHWWRLQKLSDLMLSFLAIVFLAYLYEFLKYYISKIQINRSGTITASNTSRNYRVYNSCWYGLQVGYSFMLMLVFMTYNGWLMIAVVVGAIWGNYSWGSRVRPSTDESSLACH